MPGTNLTLDTNLLQEYWKKRAKAAVVEQILQLAAAGAMSLVVTARLRDDVPRPPLADEIKRLPELNVAETGSVTRLDHWVLGRDMLGSDEFLACASRIESDLQRRGIVPPDWRDWDHLHAHYLLRRDVFLTWDKAVLATAAQLREELGVVVLTPEMYLEARLGGVCAQQVKRGPAG